MWGMSINHASVAEQKKSGVAGRFGTKATSAPTGALTPVSAPRPLTPAEVRTANYSASVIREGLEEFEANENIRSFERDGGGLIVQWDQANQYRDTDQVWAHQVHLDDDGDVAQVLELGLVTREESAAASQADWVDSDFDGRDTAKHQLDVNLARLRAMGGAPDPAANDGGYTGYKFTGGKHAEGARLSNTEVAKRVRQDLKEAQKWGAVPEEYSFAVLSNPYSITATVQGMPDSEHYVEREEGYTHGTSAKVRTVEETVKTVVDQWNVQDVDSQIDFFNVRYYSRVHVEDESSRKFRLEQREIARRKREARKAA